MEPEREPSPVDIELLPEKNISLRKTISTARTFLLLAVLIVLLYVFTAQGPFRFGSQLPMLPPENQELQEDPTVITREAIYTSNRENITFRIPLGWNAVPFASTTPPRGVKDVWFFVEEPVSGCYLAAGAFETEYGVTHEHVSFADRIFSRTYQFDGAWYVPVDVPFDPLSRDFPPEYRLYNDNEIRVSNDIGKAVFMLWHKDGMSVPDSCNTAMNDLLSTVESYYEQKTITAETSGFLSINETLQITLPNDETYNAMFLEDGVESQGNFLVYKNKIYGLKQTDPYFEGGALSSEIVVIDPVASTMETIPGTVAGDSYISDLYIHEGVLYFIRGGRDFGSCLDGYSQCFGNLYSVNVTGGEPRLLVERVGGDSISGYSQSDNSLYLGHFRGDAGCGSISYVKVDLYSNMQFGMGSAQGCYDEFDSSGMAVYEALMATINAKLIETKYSSLISIEKGILRPTEKEREASYNSFRFVE